ncbi:hypothetical protein [Streptomyces sp. JJ38]|uniref:hypothetical protein n=1 Tax=Streptomyces sp. JJ38 TaxID=2738128 RepID=UPI001C570B93|nr:hypothetical protein [Streptomyces sp. JJ38]MBW1595891.1 hypothetical protein [Streptomyces sp. JJ38]
MERFAVGEGELGDGQGPREALFLLFRGTSRLRDHPSGSSLHESASLAVKLRGGAELTQNGDAVTDLPDEGQPIEAVSTVYSGTTFRSRLEADWASTLASIFRDGPSTKSVDRFRVLG